MLEISIDGGKTYVEVDGVRMRYSELLHPDPPDDEPNLEVMLQINATHEGFIYDLFEMDEDGGWTFADVTGGEMANEMVERLMQRPK